MKLVSPCLAVLLAAGITAAQSGAATPQSTGTGQQPGTGAKQTPATKSPADPKRPDDPKAGRRATAGEGSSETPSAAQPGATARAQKSGPRASGAATPQAAAAFAEKAEQQMMEASNRAGRASWIQSNFITVDTEALAAEENAEFLKLTSELAVGAARFNKLKLPYDVSRKLNLIKLASSVPPPRDPKVSARLAETISSMESDYGKGKYCPPANSRAAAAIPRDDEDKCLDVNDITKLFAENRDPELLREIWIGWHAVGAPMRDRYTQFVSLSNTGARDLGFADTGAFWRSKYDMPPDAFSAEVERLWTQVRPLYEQLHTYVRSRLREKYGDLVPENGPIPAHLLGNIWSQDWSNVYEFVAPPASDPGYSVDQILKQRNISPVEMARIGERFFSSLGFEPLPKTFWERSLFTKPRDRDVVCHASAWNVDNVNDLRIKMCIQQTEEDFTTVHHELGHNYYQRAYNKQPFLYRDSANDGFHEATGDTIALSITPDYLKRIGFIQQVPPESGDIGLLMKRALEGVAFLPFGVVIDQWRWRVFSGDIKPEEYNRAWWEMRRKYQGIEPPVQRTEEQFDPGAKYHVPGNTPYTRYFLARLLQFQFYRALCREAGYQGPLHRCSFYESKAAGARLNKMLEMGASRPWPEALKAISGETRMDGGAMLEYFAPLMKWLEEQNKGKKVGW